VEDDNLDVLKQIAVAQIKSAGDFDKYLRQHLKQGISYDDARCEVIKKILPQVSPAVITKILKGSNNILAIEYLRELYKLKSKITPVAVLRKGAAHTDPELKENFTSALALRDAISVEERPLELADYIPRSIVPVTEAALAHRPVRALFETSTLFETLTNPNAKKIYNVSDELHNLFEKHQPMTQAELEANIPTRRYSISRVKRAALHSTLGVTKNDIHYLYRYDFVPYTKLLAILADADELFAELSSQDLTPVIVRGNKNKPRKCTYTKRIMQIDKKAEILYQITCRQKFPDKPLFIQK
jgi:predicted nucleotidyltransferase